MSGFTFFIIAVLCIGAFVWSSMSAVKSDSKNEAKATARDYSDRYSSRYILSATKDVEQAYKIVTVYPPACLKPYLAQEIRFCNTANDDIVFDPTYKVSISCACSYTSEMFYKYMHEKNNDYAVWRYKELETFGKTTSLLSEISLKTETEGVRWSTLKNGVIKNLKSSHPSWEIKDSGFFVNIKFR